MIVWSAAAATAASLPQGRGEPANDSWDGRLVRLTEMEYRLLFELSVNAGRVLTHAEILQQVWGPAHSGSPASVRTVVKNLRRKLGDDADNPTYIFNEPRLGYRMEREETNERGTS